MATINIAWFRKGLRMHDNISLQINCDFLLPIFIIDPAYYKESSNRYKFLIESLIDLNTKLSLMNSKLFVFKGDPKDVLKDIISKTSIFKQTLSFEKDSEPYYKNLDRTIIEYAKEKDVKIETYIGHTLFDPEEITRIYMDKVPLSYTAFMKCLEKAKKPRKPFLAPAELPPLPNELNFSEFTLTAPLEVSIHPGGETEALIRLENYLKNTKQVCEFEKPMTNPAAFNPASTTVLSPYLTFGCLSVRLFYDRLMKVYQESKSYSRPPVSLLGQLYWREFYYVAGYGVPNFDKMIGNPICLQTNWKINDEALELWKHGRTGYPWIDAIMRQLKQEGWIHHLARHSVACFLTRGDLYISWESGAHVFEEFLLDADWSLNTGNWLWLSASAFFHQYFRVYSPISFGKKYDKQGKYIKKYVPELKDFPLQYIFEPWKAPKSIQQKAKCILGVDYPMPIVDHEIVKLENLEYMKAAYEKRNYSNKRMK